MQCGARSEDNRARRDDYGAEREMRQRALSGVFIVLGDFAYDFIALCALECPALGSRRVRLDARQKCLGTAFWALRSFDRTRILRKRERARFHVISPKPAKLPALKYITH